MEKGTNAWLKEIDTINNPHIYIYVYIYIYIYIYIYMYIHIYLYCFPLCISQSLSLQWLSNLWYDMGITSIR